MKDLERTRFPWINGLAVVIMYGAQSLKGSTLCAPRLVCLWGFPGNNTGVGCHALLQGIFPTQESSLMHHRRFFTS